MICYSYLFAHVNVSYVPVVCSTCAGIRVTRDQASRQPFLKGDGFDLYIDLGGGMPYPCTVSKVVVRVIGYAGEQVRL